jgi:pantoate--beta-alanine ligase
VFGKKDYQQLMVIRQMCHQFAIPVDIIPAETIRAEDGLALSSRNGYLSAEERAEAVQLIQLLKQVQDKILQGKVTPEEILKIEQEASAQLASRGWKPDYISVRKRKDLLSATDIELQSNEKLVVLAAAKIGKTRLIDNLEI